MPNVGFLIADNSRLARWAFDRQVREIGVTGPQARLLLLLNRFPGENQGFYAEQIEVEPITLCRMVDRLEDAGLVERKPCTEDRRARRLHLTAKSRQTMEQLQAKVDALLDGMLAGLSETERGEFMRMLATISANLAARRETLKAADG
jgi:DNA-binding MarR family transcriptional regulator